MGNTMKIYLDVWKNYFTLSGRAGRKEFWTFLLVNLAILAPFMAWAFMSGKDIAAASLPVNIFRGFFLLILIPLIAVSVRRLHDLNMSGWWYLMNFIPIVGDVAFLILMLIPGKKEENRFGPPV